MKKIVYGLSCFMAVGAMFSCGGGTSTQGGDKPKDDSTKTVDTPAKPEYRAIDKPKVDLSKFTKDKDGYVVIFDGKTFEGWRGYGKDTVPGKWTIDQGAIKFNGTGGGEAQDKKEGGDIVFAHKFKNFHLSLEWKVAKGANSGIFYLAQEIESKDPKTGEWRMEPIYISSPEAQVLDNANHIDAGRGVDGNRQASSLYDMIPAKPQNAKPFDQWNHVEIIVSKGTVIHRQNGADVVEYHLWTQQWTDMLQNSKFKEESKEFPLAFELLNNCGGENHEGYIGLQDHGDDVWFRNIKVKILD